MRGPAEAGRLFIFEEISKIILSPFGEIQAADRNIEDAFDAPVGTECFGRAGGGNPPILQEDDTVGIAEHQVEFMVSPSRKPSKSRP